MRGTKLLATFIICLGLFLVTGCSSPAGSATDQQDDAQSVTTSEDTTSGLPAGYDPLEGITSSSRVVALSRSLGDMWLLAGGQLAGITEDGLTLQGIDEDTQTIGTLTKPDIQTVLDQEPDLVLLTQDIPAHQQAKTEIEQAGVPAMAIDINSFEDYAQLMETFTQITGRNDLYQKNVKNVQAQIDNIVQNAGTTQEVSYVVLRVSPTSNKLLGSDSFVCNMMDQMGLTNALPNGQVQEDVTPQAIAKINPDRVFVVFQGGEEQARKVFEDTFTADSAWGQLTAAKNARVVVLPKTLFQYKPNAKWGEAYSYISQMLHGSWA